MKTNAKRFTALLTSLLLLASPLAAPLKQPIAATKALDPPGSSAEDYSDRLELKIQDAFYTNGEDYFYIDVVVDSLYKNGVAGLDVTIKYPTEYFEVAGLSGLGCYGGISATPYKDSADKYGGQRFALANGEEYGIVAEKGATVVSFKMKAKDGVTVPTGVFDVEWATAPRDGTKQPSSYFIDSNCQELPVKLSGGKIAVDTSKFTYTSTTAYTNTLTATTATQPTLPTVTTTTVDTYKYTTTTATEKPYGSILSMRILSATYTKGETVYIPIIIDSFNASQGISGIDTVIGYPDKYFEFVGIEGGSCFGNVSFADPMYSLEKWGGQRIAISNSYEGGYVGQYKDIVVTLMFEAKQGIEVPSGIGGITFNTATNPYTGHCYTEFLGPDCQDVPVAIVNGSIYVNELPGSTEISTAIISGTGTTVTTALRTDITYPYTGTTQTAPCDGQYLGIGIGVAYVSDNSQLIYVPLTVNSSYCSFSSDSMIAGIMGVDATIQFNTKYFEMVSVEKCCFGSLSLTPFELAAEKYGGVRFAASNMGGYLAEVNDTVLYLVLKVKDGVNLETGVYPITWSNASFINGNLDEIPFVGFSGSIYVKFGETTYPVVTDYNTNTTPPNTYNMTTTTCLQVLIDIVQYNHSGENVIKVLLPHTAIDFDYETEPYIVIEGVFKYPSEYFKITGCELGHFNQNGKVEFMEPEESLEKYGGQWFRVTVDKEGLLISSWSFNDIAKFTYEIKDDVSVFTSIYPVKWMVDTVKLSSGSGTALEGAVVSGAIMYSENSEATMTYPRYNDVQSVTTTVVTATDNTAQPIGTVTSTSVAGAEGIGEVSSTMPQQPKADAMIVGDANFDGVIDAADASAVLTAYALIMTNGIDADYDLVRYDANGDGVIDASDASLILSYYAYIMTDENRDFSLFEFNLNIVNINK